MGRGREGASGLGGAKGEKDEGGKEVGLGDGRGEECEGRIDVISG